MNIKRLAVTGVVALVVLLATGVGLAGAGSYTTGFESFTVGTVDGQDGWHSAAPGDIPALPDGYDQAVVNTSGFGSPAGFGTKALRVSNAYSEPTAEFFFQTYSAPTADPAGETQTNKVFDGTFQFISTSASYQPGLNVSVSPDNGEGGRMSYLALTDTASGIQATFYDVAEDGTFREFVVPGYYTRNAVHTVRFLIETVPGEANDILRLYIDGVDIGDELGECFTTWEQYYRVSEQHEPGVIDSFEFRTTNGWYCAANGATPNAAGTCVVAGLLGGGYLFDNVTTTTRNADGPAPTQCGAAGAFCSPGFWKNASDEAWDQTGFEKGDLFNEVVVPDFYANSIKSGTTLWDVLTAKSATKYGKAAGPFGLNPFNAVGAALTSAVPGYVFDPDAYAQSRLGIDTCPLDHHGNVIPPV